MVEFVVLLILGIACIAMGIVTATGNLIFIKNRSKRNVTESEKQSFALLNGVAVCIIGVGMIVMSVLSRIFENDDRVAFALIPFFVIAFALLFFASIKYNRK